MAAAPAGQFQGITQNGFTEFRGIHYAQPPVGNLRWQPPVPMPDSKSVIDATHYAPACPQSALSGDAISVAAPKLQSEDCLTLNIWSPAHSGTEKLPVMVWIHGGWFARGDARSYPANDLAKRGNVVVVTIDYRLGPLGFLADPLLTAESPQHTSGNDGLLDQIAALRWVQRNIGAFGGDASRVTIFGQSAGGVSVCYLLASPLTRGLFQRAIMESGTCEGMRPAPLAEKSKQGLQLAAKLHCDTAPGILACMRAKPSSDILAALPTQAAYGASTYFSPNRDGYVLPAPARELLANDASPDVAVMIGSTLNDASRFVPAIKSVQAWRDYVAQHWPHSQGAVLALYTPPSDAATQATVVRAFTQMHFGCPTLEVANIFAKRGAPVYLYLFDQVPWFGAQHGIGSYHAAELPYVFGRLIPKNGHRYDAADEHLSAYMIHAWAAFAATGSPNGPGLAPWPVFKPGGASVQRIDSSPTHVANPQLQACNALQKIGY